MTQFDQLRRLLEQSDDSQRREIFGWLRAEFPIHRLEQEFGAPAEVILEAILRSSDLTKRGIRGIIAEAAFDIYVLSKLEGWRFLAVTGDPPYDSLIEDADGQVRIQVKMQRLRKHEPMRARQGYRVLPADMFVVETQRTRGGKDPLTKEDTRPYRFGEFDILAVSLHPSTGDWSQFLYTVANWLIPQHANPKLILKFQPLPMQPEGNWTNDLLTVITWFRSKVKRQIWEAPSSDYKARKPRQI
jgi:hypothetical protein